MSGKQSSGNEFNLAISLSLSAKRWSIKVDYIRHLASKKNLLFQFASSSLRHSLDDVLKRFIHAGEGIFVSTSMEVSVMEGAI